jgi:hypothetical protein
LPGERTLSVNGSCAKGNNSDNTQRKTNSLADWQLKLAVLVGVPPVIEVKLFTPQKNFSLLVIGSIDDVVNEGTVASFVRNFGRRLRLKDRINMVSSGNTSQNTDFLFDDTYHVHGHAFVVGQVLVALGADRVEGGAHGNNAILVNIRLSDIVSVLTFAVIRVICVVVLL